MWRKDFAQVVRTSLAEARKKSVKLSLRSFAKRLGISVTALTDLLAESEGWRISEERASEILDRLELEESRKNHLRARMKIPVAYRATPLAAADAELLADRYYAAVASAYDLPPELRDEQRIAEKLGLSIDQVRSMTRELLGKGHLVQGADGIVSRAEMYWVSSEQIPKDVVRSHHAQGFRVAEAALYRVDEKRRVYGTLTFAGSSKNLERIREEIRSFEERVMALLDEGPYDEVFQLQVALTPFT